MPLIYPGDTDIQGDCSHRTSFIFTSVAVMAVIKQVYSCWFCIMRLGDYVCVGVKTFLGGHACQHLDGPVVFYPRKDDE